METDELCLRPFSKWFLSKKLEHSINSPRKCLTSARFWKLELNISINWNDYWQLSVLVFISKSFELCFSYHCVSLLFTEPLMLVATMSLVGQIPECTNYLLLREVRRPQVKSASVYVNGLIKNQTQQTNKQKSHKTKHFFIPCPGVTFTCWCCPLNFLLTSGVTYGSGKLTMQE